MMDALDRIIQELEDLTPSVLVKFLLNIFKADSRVTEDKLNRRILQNFDKGQFLSELKRRSVSGLTMEELVYSVLFPEERPKRLKTASVEEERHQSILVSIRNEEEGGLEVRSVELEGVSQRGVFTTRAFSKGDFICEYAGKLMTAREANKLPDRGDNDYTFFFKHKTSSGENWCINAEEETPRLGRLINHGTPNVQPFTILVDEIPRIYFKAIVNIPPGQELLYDYNDRRKDVLESNRWLRLSEVKKRSKLSAAKEMSGTKPAQKVGSNTSHKGRDNAPRTVPPQKEANPPQGLSVSDGDTIQSNLESMFLKAREDVSSNQAAFTRVNLFTNIGRREYMEDIVQFKCGEYDGTVVLFAAIYDGHGGSQAAIYCRDNLVDNIKSYFNEISVDGVENALRKGFAATHANMLKVQGTWRNRQGLLGSTAGTTASVLVLFNQTYVVGYVGDSSVYAITLNKELKSRCEKLTTPHSPRSRTEVERVVRAGGKIAFRNGDCRVVGGKTTLNMTRAMGNFWSLTKKGLYAISKEPSIISGSSASTAHFVLTSDGCDILSLKEMAELVDENKYSNYLSRYFVGAALEKYKKLLQPNADNTSSVVVSVALQRLQELYNPQSPELTPEDTYSTLPKDVCPEQVASSGAEKGTASASRSRNIQLGEDATAQEVESIRPEVSGQQCSRVETSEAESGNGAETVEEEEEHASKKRIRRSDGKFLPNPGGYRAPYRVPKSQYGRIVTRTTSLSLRSRQLQAPGSTTEPSPGPSRKKPADPKDVRVRNRGASSSDSSSSDTS